MDVEQERKAQAKENVRLGYCPCGDEDSRDCECFGIWRLGVVQGLTPVEVVRSAPS